MKTLVWSLIAVMTVFGLAACDKKKGDKGDNFVTSANSCFNYAYNHQLQYYTDQYGNRVNCDQGYYNGLNNFVPSQHWVNGQFMSGCSYWSQVYPGSFYTPVNIQGHGLVCVKQSYFQSLPGFQNYHAYYGRFPMYARSCEFGGCGGCYGGAQGGVSAGVNMGGFWLGGSLALCF